MEKICYIIGACAPGRIVIADRDAAFVIAADGGLRYLEESGVTADLVVGDFDSLGRIPVGENTICHPVEKDDTDTMLAVKLGLERGYREFVFYGCLGGRPDHTYANQQTLLYLARRSARGYLVGEGWVSCAVQNGRIDFPAQLTGTISVFCPDGEAHGVDLEGLYYPLRDGSLGSDFPLGVSNHFVGECSGVSVKNGTLLVMWEEAAECFVHRLLRRN